jgi:hypothetical protein
MDKPTDQTVITFVLDCPDEAADELAKLRALKAWLISTLEPVQAQLQKPMPEGLSVYEQGGEYAERSGLGRGAINAALEQLKK